jgi:hypothetical protein
MDDNIKLDLGRIERERVWTEFRLEASGGII